MKNILVGLLVLSSLVSCGVRSTTSDEMEQKKTAKMTAEATRRLGLPDIKNFTEKRFMKMIYELKDREVPTFTYLVDMNGGLHFLCNSVGFGVPASVQYVNPERIAYTGHNTGVATLPQPEPNGMFMPSGLDATYVLCISAEGEIKPVYSEPKLLVSPFKLKAKKNLM